MSGVTRLARYREKHPDRVNNSAAKCRANRIKATPAWENLTSMGLMYSIAVRVSNETGIGHHVDHIIPLNNKLVCGLRVGSNPQLLTAANNINKGNKHDICYS